MSDFREASLEPATDRLPGPLAQAGPFALLAAGASWLALRWSGLPARVPVHWNFRGEANRYVARAPLPLALPLLLGAAVCLLLLAFQLGIRHGAPRHAARGASLRLLLWGEYVAAAACCTGVAAMVTGGRLLLPGLLISLPGLLAVVLGALALRRAPRGPSRNPHSWRGPFYADRSDPALFVPRRSGLGYTVNLGHRLAPLVALATLALPLLALLLAFTAR